MRDCKIILPVSCNANCSFCFTKEIEWADNFEECVKANLDKLPEKVVANITGGEPTAYYKLAELLEILHNHENVEKVILTTNGYRLHEIIHLAEYLTHLNISRHHYDDMLNVAMFNADFKVDYNVIKHFQKHGIDVRCHTYLSKLFKSCEELDNMVSWAKAKGFDSIKFRNDFNHGLDISKYELIYQEKHNCIYEDSCPVCRVDVYADGIPVLFSYGMEEPSNFVGDFEYILNQDGKIYWDYKCKKPISDDTLLYMGRKKVGQTYGCGGTVYNIFEDKTGYRWAEQERN